MNLKELTWPLQLYWDLLPEASAYLCDNEICNGMLEAKILYLGLSDTSSCISPACINILDCLQGKNIAISLTLRTSAVGPDVMALLADKKIKTLLIGVSSLDAARLAVARLRDSGPEARRMGLSFDIDKDNYRDIPELISLCIEKGVPELVFPIQRHKAGEDCFFTGPTQRADLITRLGSVALSGIRLTVHDPFLWNVFYPETDYPEGGCQAANSMLFITSAYKVWPCPVFPSELGDLQKRSLKEIILSENKKRLRMSLLSPPKECIACGQSARCFGGCRGRALVSSGSLECADPSCAGLSRNLFKKD